MSFPVKTIVFVIVVVVKWGKVAEVARSAVKIGVFGVLYRGE